MTQRLVDTRQKLESARQRELLDVLAALDEKGRDALLDQLDGVDLSVLGEDKVTSASRTAPLPPVCHAPVGTPEFGERDESARAAGIELLRCGRVAALTVAGGQGTRLGWRGPKGTYPATPVTGKPLFRCFAEQILALERRCGIVLPWYIMTSPANDAETRAFFVDNNCFGLSRRQIMLFPQGMMPAIDAASGAMLFASADRLAMSPDGHGGVIAALRRSGAIDDMRRRGIEHISYFQVDNPLVPVVDPVFLGLHACGADSSGEMSSKMVRKTEPTERVGLLVRVPRADGSGEETRILEYSDAPPEIVDARDEDGGLRFHAGNVAVHMLGVTFVERLASDDGPSLPYHQALKSVSAFDRDQGKTVEPSAPNAMQFETFIFDALPLAERSLILEVRREDEFAPIKNASGRDSPATSHAMQTARAARWLEAHGVKIARDDAGEVAALIEIGPLTAIEASDLDGATLPEAIAAGEAVAI